MSKLLDVEKELSEWRKKKKDEKGKEIPEHLRIEILKLLSEYSSNHIQKKLGLNSRTLKDWKKKYKKVEDFLFMSQNYLKKK